MSGRRSALLSAARASASERAARSRPPGSRRSRCLIVASIRCRCGELALDRALLRTRFDATTCCLGRGAFFSGSRPASRPARGTWITCHDVVASWSETRFAVSMRSRARRGSRRRAAPRASSCLAAACRARRRGLRGASARCRGCRFASPRWRAFRAGRCWIRSSLTLARLYASIAWLEPRVDLLDLGEHALRLGPAAARPATGRRGRPAAARPRQAEQEHRERFGVLSRMSLLLLESAQTTRAGPAVTRVGRLATPCGRLQPDSQNGCNSPNDRVTRVGSSGTVRASCAELRQARARADLAICCELQRRFLRFRRRAARPRPSSRSRATSCAAGRPRPRSRERAATQQLYSIESQLARARARSRRCAADSGRPTERPLTTARGSSSTSPGSPPTWREEQLGSRIRAALPATGELDPVADPPRGRVARRGALDGLDGLGPHRRRATARSLPRSRQARRSSPSRSAQIAARVTALARRRPQPRRRRTEARRARAERTAAYLAHARP